MLNILRPKVVAFFLEHLNEYNEWPGRVSFPLFFFFSYFYLILLVLGMCYIISSTTLFPFYLRGGGGLALVQHVRQKYTAVFVGYFVVKEFLLFLVFIVLPLFSPNLETSPSFSNFYLTTIHPLQWQPSWQASQ